MLLGFDLPLVDTGIDTPPEAIRCIASLVGLYVIAAVQPAHPRTSAPLQPVAHSLIALVRDFSQCKRGFGRTSWARSRWPRRRCSGASAATCATSCWPGRWRRWAMAR